MKFTRIFLCLFIFSNFDCLILKKEKHIGEQKERLLNVLANPLGDLLAHTDQFVGKLDDMNKTFESLTENISDKKKDIYKNMDTILSDFLAEHNPLKSKQIDE